jgi:hemolysin activation/secretion protein
VRATGAHYFSERRIRLAIPEATSGNVPNLPKLQEELTQVNAAGADRSVTPVLKAGSQPGTVDLALNVHDQLPLQAAVELNNEQTENTHPLRALFSLSYSDLFGRLDQISLQYQDTPEKWGQVGVFAANLAMHLYQGGPSLAFYYVDSKTSVATLGALGVLGKGSIYGLRLVDVLENVERTTSTLTFGIDYKHFLQSITVDPETALNTPNSYMLFSADYAQVWRSEKRQWNVDIAASLGSRQFVNDSAHFATARFQGRPNFFFLHGGASLNERLPAGLRLTARVAGQAAVEPLVSNEYFSIAGADGVRGYLEAEQFGDMGIKGTLQLASPQWHAFNWGFAANAFAFYDAGRVTFLAALPGQLGHAELRSTGAGFELTSAHSLTGSLTWAYPLVRAPITGSGDSKVLFVIRASL